MTPKRERLVTAASRVIHEQGYVATTLTMVAADAAVPLGNVYYYFKTKHDLALAVIDSRIAEIQSLLAYADRAATPTLRVAAFLDAFAEHADSIVERGCPYSSLVQELVKGDAAWVESARLLFTMQIGWLEAQFGALGAGAPRRAAELMCALHGACLIALALDDAEFLRTRLGELRTAVLVS